MYQLYIYIIVSIVFESGGGMLYGVAAGFDPLFVFATTLTINIITVFGAIFLIDKLLNWKKGLRIWLEKRTARGQRLINKYAVVGIIVGVFVLSPMQIAIVGRLLRIHSNSFYPTLVGGTVLSAIVSMAIALGIFKLLLHW
jgi:uncharacterized membrane protein